MEDPNFVSIEIVACASCKGALAYTGQNVCSHCGASPFRYVPFKEVNHAMQVSE